MGFYDRYLLPKLIHFTCGQGPIRRQREKVVPLARGRVVEIGIGSGLNLPFYDPTRVERVWGLDPAAEMTRMALPAAEAVEFEVELVNQPADEIPLPEGSADCVVCTYTLCTVPDPAAALAEIRRVLTPGGRLIFSEHGAAPDAAVRRWQNGIDPLWKRLAGGCHLNREIPRLIEAAGFEFETLDQMYLPGWRPASFNFWGCAVRP